MIRLYEQAREAAEHAKDRLRHSPLGRPSDRESQAFMIDAAISKTLELVEQEVRRRAEDPRVRHYQMAPEALSEVADFLRQHQREAQ